MFTLDPRGPFCRAASSQRAPSPQHWMEAVAPQVQDLAFPCVEFCEVPIPTFLQPVRALVSTTASMQSIKQSSHGGITHRLARGVLCPITPVINEDVKHYQLQNWLQHGLLRCTTSD